MLMLEIIVGILVIMQELGEVIQVPIEMLLLL